MKLRDLLPYHEWPTRISFENVLKMSEQLLKVLPNSCATLTIYAEQYFCYDILMHKGILKKIVAIFNTGDTTDVDTIFSPGYTDHQKPKWILHDGPEEFKQIVAGARESLPNLIVTVTGPIVTEDDMVVGRLNWLSDNVERETIDILRIDVNGQVAEHWGAEAWRKAIHCVS